VNRQLLEARVLVVGGGCVLTPQLRVGVSRFDLRLAARLRRILITTTCTRWPRTAARLLALGDRNRHEGQAEQVTGGVNAEPGYCVLQF
jgi:hypothetical protein